MIIIVHIIIIITIIIDLPRSCLQVNQKTMLHYIQRLCAVMSGIQPASIPLPTELRTINCTDTFKRRLKTHFFNRGFLD